MCPWNLLKSSNNFTTYLASYSVFLSAIIGVLFCDYFLIRRGRLVVPELYTLSSSGFAHYWKGIHWRAYVAYICGIIPNAPGMLRLISISTGERMLTSVAMIGFGAAVGASDVALGAKRIYQLNFFVGFIVSFGLYYILCRFVGTVPGMATKGWHEDLHYEPEDDVSEVDSPGIVRASSSDKDLGSDVTKMA